jgi:HK97 family phage major capsid protein
MTKIAGEYGEYGTHLTTEYDAYPLIPETVANEIMDGIVESSAALALFDKLPNMSSRTHRMPILSTLGQADFTGEVTSDSLVDGADQQIDDERMLAIKGMPYGTGDPGYVPNEGAPGLKKTLQMAWENVFIVAETIAIIVPIPDDVLADSSYDLWGAVKPRIIETFDRRIDGAMIWGQNRPVTWPTGIVPTAISRGQVVAVGTGADLAIDVSNTMGVLEEAGFSPDGFIAPPQAKARLRNFRDANGNIVFTPGLKPAPDSVYGLPVSYQKNGEFDTTVAAMIAGDMKQAKFAIREDMSFKIFTEGVISDSEGKVILNLMQQDAKAMRVVMRIGWAVPNPIHALNPDRASYPFAILTP